MGYLSDTHSDTSDYEVVHRCVCHQKADMEEVLACAGFRFVEGICPAVEVYSVNLVSDPIENESGDI